MTSVVFEAAGLADALAKATRVAPTRGEGFDKAAGILIEVNPADNEVVIMATDTITRFSTWITPESIDGDPAIWRLPARGFPDVIAKLKTTRTKTLSLTQTGDAINLVHGNTRAQFMMLDAKTYPRWLPFSPDEMVEVTGLAKAVSLVQWAAAKTGEPPLIGVYFDGEHVLATDRYRFASAPCKLDLPEGITVPPAAITGILKSAETVLMRVEGSRICIMPDDYTQIAMRVYGVPYPPVGALMKRDYPRFVTINKAVLTDGIELVMQMVGADRTPSLLLLFGRQQVAAMIETEGTGKVGHIMDVPDQLDFSERNQIRFSPENIIAALAGSPGTEVRIGYDPNDKFGAVYVDGGGDGVEFWLAPRQKLPSDT